MQNSELEIIESIRSQLADLEQMISADELHARKRAYTKLSSEMPTLDNFYDLREKGKRWMTCAQICEEIGIEPSRSNCTMLGNKIPGSVQRRRSNGKNLLLMPYLIERF